MEILRPFFLFSFYAAIVIPFMLMTNTGNLIAQFIIETGEPLPFLFLSLPSIFGGIYITNRYLKNFLMAYSSRNWTHIKGRLVRKKIVTQHQMTKNGSFYYDSLEIEYKYTVGKYTYTGHTLSFNDVSSIDYKDKLPDERQQITVYYNQQAGRSVLFPGIKNFRYSGLYLLSIFPLFGIALGLSVLNYYFRFI
ncbi:hypothetical protein MNBD_GAMMA10-3071 [hydrothermal vent metagenome]|uniref:DUF3592 domain-containing protein n=1 Tax=hydrothermal vent metagenome TaxID=652676 RepID=A0A3B0XMZ9_9ZZZZ